MGFKTLAEQAQFSYDEFLNRFKQNPLCDVEFICWFRATKMHVPVPLPASAQMMEHGRDAVFWSVRMTAVSGGAESISFALPMRVARIDEETVSPAEADELRKLSMDQI